VWFDGQDLVALTPDELRPLRWRQFSMVFQGAMNALNPVKTVGWQIAEAIRQHDRGVAQDEAEAQAGRLLETVGIGQERAGDYPTSSRAECASGP